jgi:putative ABC transport system permease protein
MDELGGDVRHALRRLARTPGFTSVALLTLALGIGANTAMFSVVHAVLLRPLSFHEPDRLYQIWSRHTSTDRYPFQLPEFCDYRDQNKTLEGMAAFGVWSASLTGDGPAERLSGTLVTGNFFEVLGARAAIGRALEPADDGAGREKVAVLTHGLWQRRFGGDPGIVGRRLLMGGEPYTVVGVMDRDFVFPMRTAEVAVALSPEQDPRRHNRKSTNFLRAIGRARPGVTRAQITDDLDAIGRRLFAEFPDSYGGKKGVLAVLYSDEVTRNVRQTLWVLLGAVALLLLIACANLANLMLVRATDRRREMAVRQALGARRRELLRPLLMESALLATFGAGLGTLLAWAAVPAIVAASPEVLPRAREIQVSLPVLTFTAVAAVVAGIAFGLVPAVRAARLDPGRDLKAEGRGSSGGAERSRVRGVIVAAQVALMTVLLSGAGLLFKSFREVLRVEPGFDAEVLTVRLSLPRKDYDQTAKLSQFYRQLEARVLALPGVAAVGAVNQVPLNGALATTEYKLPDGPPVPDSQLPTAQYRTATPRFFETMGIPVTAGRAFGDEDREGAEPVAIVSASLARLSFGAGDPVGQHLLVRDTPGGFRPMRIVGVAGDVRHYSLETASEPHVYVPYHQVHKDVLVWVTLNQWLVVRTHTAPLGLAEAVRRELQQVDPMVAAADLRTTGDYVGRATAPRRFSLLLLAGFASVALAMAAVGIYGVVSYTVAQRTREIGVRLALGAGMGRIVAMVLGEGIRRTAIGLVLGLVGAYAAGRAVRGLLFGVPATDAGTYAAVVALLVVVTLVAAVLPAWRAARVDPLAALRWD